MAFMMPVVKNDWDIYKSGRSRRTSENTEKAGGRVRKVSESRSEGPPLSLSARSALSPHRSAPAMRSLSYSRARPTSLAVGPKGSASPPPPAAPAPEKFHSRLVEKLRRALSRSDSRADERTS